MCARLIYWRGFRSFELDQISELEWEDRDSEWATTCTIAYTDRTIQKICLDLRSWKTTVHVLEITWNSFWCGFRDSKHQQQKQSILGYELVQCCSQRRKYWIASVDCDSQTKNAMRFCSVSLKRKEPTALSLRNILVHGTLVQSAIITGNFWAAGWSIAFRNIQNATKMFRLDTHKLHTCHQSAAISFFEFQTITYTQLLWSTHKLLGPQVCCVRRIHIGSSHN